VEDGQPARRADRDRLEVDPAAAVGAESGSAPAVRLPTGGGATFAT